MPVKMVQIRCFFLRYCTQQRHVQYSSLHQSFTAYWQLI